MGNTGKLIVICGIDGAGKSTQINMLYNRLVANGENCKKIVFAYNDYGDVAKSKIRNLSNCNYIFTRANIEWKDQYPLINDFVYNRELQKRELAYTVSMIFAGGCIQIYEECIKPLLLQGVNVVLDRYFYDDMVYRSFWIDEDFLKRMYSLLPLGDLNIYLKVDEYILIERNKKRKDGKSLLLSNSENYAKLDKKFTKIFDEIKNGTVLYGNRSAVEINEDIYDLVIKNS